MRALAERLGVRPNALYSHVASKTALIDELLDDALAAVLTPPADAADPIAAMHALMSSTYHVLLTHADLITLYLTRQGARGPNAQRLGEIMYALLDRGSVSGQRASEALHVLIVYTIGSAAFATRSPLSTTGTTPAAAEDHTAHFDHGLRWLITGISQPENNSA
jgi:TetR/AcrR family transcriptional regulator, tetracycline repressor protein